ncbi:MULTISPECIES: YpmS family protein [Aerococcus]|uniref:YpmS family protein n=1 Tax=Aerococcus TaxID=1375 RepID=UPI000DCBB70D|nr:MULTISPECIES: YpmS family protein [Aerococcus]MDL5183513.1 YpmS family protein [Aerococcus mictus]MBU5610314.1 YpmS family protein [Aerococcus urinae]MDK6292303.1 YpmS family protein [Aerococcus urinae]MDK6375772.1 YpmS family protein [Aerococcus urinae]MDK6421599.1 YpmS family protein [Aerococcus urinae]
MENKKKQRNPWKIAFLSLLTFLVILFASAYFYIYQNSQANTYQDKIQVNQPKNPDQAMVPVKLAMTVDHLVRLLNQENLPFLLENNQDAVVIKGKIQLLNQSLAYTLTTRPEVHSSGNLSLKVVNFSILSLDLPLNLFLPILSKIMPSDLPLAVDTASESVIISLKELLAKEGIAFEVETIDLTNDQIVLQLAIPEQKISQILDQLGEKD